MVCVKFSHPKPIINYYFIVTLTIKNVFKTLELMNHKPILVILVIYSTIFFSCKEDVKLTSGLVQKLNDVEKAFESIDTIPELIAFTNSFPVPEGKNGHLQSAQIIDKGDSRYIILTGSSNISYSAVIKLDQKKGNKVISINHLLGNPYTHAGGMQLYGHYMAVGIEDSQLRDKSKVRIYDLSNPEDPIENPIFELLRSGEYERSTAGGIGLIEWQQHIVMLVVDWNGRNLDFYICPVEDWNLGSIEFELWKSVKTETLDKQGWVDNEWRSYQNINLLCDKNNQLYAIGFDVYNPDRNTSVADLYKLNLGNIIDDRKTPISMKKVSRREFLCTSTISFSLGAGVHIIDENRFGIIATSSVIEDTSYLNYFK